MPLRWIFSYVTVNCSQWFCTTRGMPYWSFFFVCFFFCFYQGFVSRTLTTHRTAGEGTGPFFIPLYHFHPLTKIQTFSIWNDYHIFLISTLVFTRLLLDEILPPYRITIWLIDDVQFVLVCLLGDLILGFCYSNLYTGNRWTRTCIDYHPCITSKPTNQAR